MIDIKPINDKVLAKLKEPMGETTQSKGGVFVMENHQSEKFIRPRWFEVTHIGPEQIDVTPGQFVLVEHGRWSRGIDINGTHREEDKLFLIDNDAMLMVSDDDPTQ